MRRTIEYHIDVQPQTAGRPATAGEFLRSRGFSRHLVTYLRHHENTLLVNGTAVHTNLPLRPGDVLSVTFTDEIPDVTIVPTPMDLGIVYEDEDILVVDKPPYLPVQPSLGHPEHTLGNGVAAYYQRQGLEFIYRCVNRIDRNTSGLVLIAKNMASSAILYDAMKKREIRRTYFCVVHGKIEKAGTIDLPIARKQPSLIERCVDFERGKRAVTHYQPAGQDLLQKVSGREDAPESLFSSYNPENDTTALEIHLETGRTHQIRVHMAYTGHPVVGDGLYGTSNDPAHRSGSDDLIPRQALHSFSLDFRHPVTQKEMHLEAAVPEDIRSLLTR